jgi:hypothetical protein
MSDFETKPETFSPNTPHAHSPFYAERQAFGASLIRSNRGDYEDVVSLEKTGSYRQESNTSMAMSPGYLDKVIDGQRIYKPQLDRQLSSIDSQIMKLIKQLNITKL